MTTSAHASAHAAPPWIAPERWAPWLAWSVAGVAGAVGWSALGARAHALGMEPVCLLRQVAHLACPTCGMTRATALLAAGDWRSALALHPWAPALAAQVAAGWTLWGLGLARRINGLDRWIPRLILINAAALISIWLARLLTGTLPPV